MLSEDPLFLIVNITSPHSRLYLRNSVKKKDFPMAQLKKIVYEDSEGRLFTV